MICSIQISDSSAPKKIGIPGAKMRIDFQETLWEFLPFNNLSALRKVSLQEIPQIIERYLIFKFLEIINLWYPLHVFLKKKSKRLKSKLTLRATQANFHRSSV